MFDRIKAKWGDAGANQRYPEADETDYQPPEEVEDPHTLRDDTEPTWREWVSDNSLFVLSIAMLGAAVLILSVIYFGRYFATFFGNPWTQRIAVAAGLVIGGYLAGQSSQKSRLKRQDELTLYDPESRRSIHYLGTFESLQGASHDVFVPLKGFRKFGHNPEPYRVGDISQELVRRHGHNPDEQARIRLHPQVTTIEPTERGRRIVQLTAGIEPDPFGRESNLEASLPDMAASETVSDLKTQLETLDEELAFLRDENDQLRRQRDSAREEAEMTYREAREQLKESADVFAQFAGRTTARRSHDREESGGQAGELVDNLANGED